MTVQSTEHHYSYFTYISDQVSIAVALNSPALSSDEKQNYINFSMSIFKIDLLRQGKTDSLYSRRFL